MNIYIINKTESDIKVQSQNESATIRPNAARMCAIVLPHMLSLNNGVVLSPTQVGTVLATDEKQQLIGIGQEFWRKHAVPDSADFAFEVVPSGEGENVNEDIETNVTDLIVETLTEHCFKVYEIQEKLYVAQDETGTKVTFCELLKGVHFKSCIETRKLSDDEYVDLLAYVNLFNNGSVLTKACISQDDLPSVCFVSWLPAGYTTEMFKNFFSTYLFEIQVDFDEDLREQIDEMLLR